VKYTGHMIDGLEAMVRRAEVTAMRDQLAPYHVPNCPCRLCTTDRWLRSPEAQEAGNNWRAR
jgi:hypothetical protein